MSHPLQSIYNKANLNRTPRREPPITIYTMSRDEIEAKYPEGKRR